MSGIETTEANAKFVRKDTQHICMVKKQRKQPDCNSSEESKSKC